MGAQRNAPRPLADPRASHVLSDQIRLGPKATGDLTLLLTAIQTTCKFIATNVRKARLINLCVAPHRIH